MISIRYLVLSAIISFPQISSGFAPSSAIAYAKLRPTKLWSETKPSTLIDSSGEGMPDLTGALEKCELHEFILNDHKPLGCSIEEGLASEPDGKSYVFVSEASTLSLTMAYKYMFSSIISFVHPISNTLTFIVD